MSSKEAATKNEPSSKKRQKTIPSNNKSKETTKVQALDDPVSNDESSSDSSSDEDDLILEGVVVRNPEASSSSDEEEDDEEEEDDNEEEKPSAGPVSSTSSLNPADATIKNAKTLNSATTTANPKKRKKSKHLDDDDLQVEFTFCDMDEKFFHGIKTLLHASSTIYAPQSSTLTDLMIENASVGTAISTEGDDEGNVFGFASVLNVSTTSSSPAIQHLKDVCLKSCPTQRHAEMETVLSGKTKRPAGFLLHGRMINLPLEIVLVLHQQLVMDMDWAVEHAEGGEEERKSLDFGAFVRLAPCTAGGGSSLFYKYFDDEILASHAEFTYTVDAPKAYGMDEKQLCQVIVITKTGHRDAIKELAEMVERR